MGTATFEVGDIVVHKDLGYTLVVEEKMGKTKIKVWWGVVISVNSVRKASNEEKLLWVLKSSG